MFFAMIAGVGRSSSAVARVGRSSSAVARVGRSQRRSCESAARSGGRASRPLAAPVVPDRSPELVARNVAVIIDLVDGSANRRRRYRDELIAYAHLRPCLAPARLRLDRYGVATQPVDHGLDALSEVGACAGHAG